MRARKEDLPIMEVEGAEIQRVEWGDMIVSYEKVPAGLDSSLFTTGLPDNRCQCPHWGYALKGRVRVRYADREEVYTAGDVYYLEPGHTEVFEEDYEAVEFSPKAEFEQTMKVIVRNLKAARSAE